MSNNSSNSSNYFKDGKTVIDYVIVIDKKQKENSDNYKFVEQYLNNLKSLGLRLETDYGNIPDNIYIKISLPEKIAKDMAINYGVDIQNLGHIPIPQAKRFRFEYFQTLLTQNNQDVFVRKQGTTSAERILLINEILSDTKFGDNNEQQGIQTLEELKLIKTSYALHEYDPIWEHTEMVNDRKKLLEYWANFRVWHKEQPLNLIEKYFGTEVAFYFAWSGFFNKMLIPASVLGVVCFSINFTRLIFSKQARIEEICNSEQIICPKCSTIFGCGFEKLNRYCSNAKLSFYFDNGRTVLFAIIISFWATILLNLWSRYEHILKIKWNVNPQMATKTREEYKSKAGYLRVSPITGELEAYISKYLQFFYVTLTYGVCLFLIFIVFLACVTVIFYRILLGTLLRSFKYKDSISLTTGACLQIIFIRFFRKGYEKWAIWLTKLEQPRTQQEFDNSVLYKLYFLSFVNNFSALFYVAFIKGRYYTPNYTPRIINFITDICEPSGCIVALCVQLSFLLFFKNLIGNIIFLIKVKIKESKQIGITHGPQFEEELYLMPNSRYRIASHFIHLIIQYGFVTFFVAAYPFAPLFALIENLLGLRITAYKLTVWQRRQIPKKDAGIGVWTNILQTMTYLSTATNAFVVGFTSDFVIRLIYYYKVDPSLKGYINSTLSVYDMKDFPGKFTGNYRYCYYRANRHPPDHPNKYQLNEFYWYEVGMRLLAVLIFEHVVAFFNAILSYAIPDVPLTVKESLQLEKNKIKDLHLAKFKTKYEEFSRELDQTTIAIRRRRSLLETHF